MGKSAIVAFFTGSILPATTPLFVNLTFVFVRFFPILYKPAISTSDKALINKLYVVV